MVFTDGKMFNDKEIIRFSCVRPRSSNVSGSFKSKVLGRKINDGFIIKDNLYEDLLLDNFIYTPTVLVNKSIFKEIGYLDENLPIAEDYDLWLRVVKKYSCVYFNKITAQFRAGDNGLSGGINSRPWRW